MNFTEVHSVQGLPQFTELTARSSAASTIGYISSGPQVGGQNTVYTTVSDGDPAKQNSLTTGTNKYPSGILSWPNPNALMQLCEKQGLQTLNLPSYSQNSPLLGVQSNVDSLRLLPSMYLPPTAQSEIPTTKQEELRCPDENAVMAQYLQKLQATTLPMTLHHLMKLHNDPGIKREEDSKLDQSQNNILNIPNFQRANGTYELIMPEINPSDLNMHIENGHENGLVGQSTSHTVQGQSVKVEHGQGESSKLEKKPKFKAKTGEIKTTIGPNGIVTYYCPECSSASTSREELDQHIQGHIQVMELLDKKEKERKYQCKECGAMLKRKEHLDQHMRGHSDERPFKCPICEKAFKRNEHLTRHYVIHSGSKNFTCTLCQKAFSRKDHLNKHTQTHSSVRKAKTRKEPATSEPIKDHDSLIDISRQELTFLLKETNGVKQDPNFLHHIQNLQRDQNFMNSYSAFKGQTTKDGVYQQQSVNMNDILPQNTRYLMPS